LEASNQDRNLFGG